MRGLFAVSVCLVLYVPAADALARPQHHHHGQVERRDGLVVIHTRSGRAATVSTRAAGAFKGFLGWLEGNGYKIATLGCYDYRNIRGTNRLSQHAFGLACDVNQVGRNLVTRGFPPGTAEAARRFGLASGAEWRHADTGHFEVARDGPSINVAGNAGRATPGHAGPGFRRLAALDGEPYAPTHRFKPCKSVGPECF